MFFLDGVLQFGGFEGLALVDLEGEALFNAGGDRGGQLDAFQADLEQGTASLQAQCSQALVGGLLALFGLLLSVKQCLSSRRCRWTLATLDWFGLLLRSWCVLLVI